MIGTFAGIPFSVSERQVLNFQGMTRNTSARYQNHEVIGQKPKKEYLGPALNDGGFTMELNASQGVKPLSVLRTLEAYILSGEASNLILGGRNYGRYVLLSKSESYEIVTQAGGIVKAKVDVTFEEYQ